MCNESVPCEISDKIGSSKSYIPFYAANTNSSLKISCPLNPLQPGDSPVILQNMNNKGMIIDSVVIEKIGKSGTNQVHSGAIYMLSTLIPSVKPLKIFKFELEKGKKKFVVEIKENIPCRYIFVQLNKPEIENDLSLIE